MLGGAGLRGYGNHEFVQAALHHHPDLAAKAGGRAVDTLRPHDDFLFGAKDWAPIQHAVNRGDRRMVLMLLARVTKAQLMALPEPSPVEAALERRYVQIAVWLVERGCPLRAVHLLPLSKAAYTSAERIDAAQRLLTLTPTTNLNAGKETPLDSAVFALDAPYALWLEQRGAEWAMQTDRALDTALELRPPDRVVAFAQAVGRAALLLQLAGASPSPQANEVLARLHGRTTPLFDATTAHEQAARFGGKALDKDAWRRPPQGLTSNTTKFLLTALAYADSHARDDGKPRSARKERVAGWRTAINGVLRGLHADVPVRSEAQERVVRLGWYVLERLRPLAS